MKNLYYKCLEALLYVGGSLLVKTADLIDRISDAMKDPFGRK